MIIMSLDFKVSPLMKRDVINIFDSLVGSILAKPGCKKVNLYSDINNDDDFLLILEWNSQREMEKHARLSMSTPEKEIFMVKQEQ